MRREISRQTGSFRSPTCRFAVNRWYLRRAWLMVFIFHCKIDIALVEVCEYTKASNIESVSYSYTLTSYEHFLLKSKRDIYVHYEVFVDCTELNVKPAQEITIKFCPVAIYYRRRTRQLTAHNRLIRVGKRNFTECVAIRI